MKIMTKTQLQKKYDDAKREIIRQHDVITVLQKKADETAVGVEQLKRATELVVTQIVLEHGADTGNGRELYLHSVRKNGLGSWTLTSTFNETDGSLKLRVEPK